MIRVVTRAAPSDPDTLADAYFAGRSRRARKLRAAESADALVQRLQLADLAAGREPVEGATIREVRRRRAEMDAADRLTPRLPPAQP